MAEENPVPPGSAKKGKNGDFVKKYKWYIIGGVAVVGILFVALRGKGASSGTGSGQSAGDYASQNAINPATGYLYGSPADLAAQGAGSTQTGIPGPQGPAGPAGPPGPAGPVTTTLPASGPGVSAVAKAVTAVAHTQPKPV